MFINQKAFKRGWLLAVGAILLIICALVVIRMLTPRAAHPPPRTSGDSLDIRLVGVRPDCGDDLYDAFGYKIKGLKAPPSVSMNPLWRPGFQRRDFLFELPDSKELILFLPDLEVSISGDNIQLSSFQQDLPIVDVGKIKHFISCEFPRTFIKKLFHIPFWKTFYINAPINRVDVTLRYYYGKAHKPLLRFAGPFRTGIAVKPDDGSAYTLTPAFRSRWTFNTAQFRLSTKRPFSWDEMTGLAYDTTGKRHLVVPGSGRSGSRRADLDFRVQDVPLDQIAAITFGEPPLEKTFHNIKVSYSDLPAAGHAGYLDKMAERLGRPDLTPDKMTNYYFANALEAIQVIDLVRGFHMVRSLEVILNAKPRLEFNRLKPEERQRLRSTLYLWANTANARTRVNCVKLGLRSQWPEFVAPTLALLDQPNGPVRAEAAYLLGRRVKHLSGEVVGRIKNGLLAKDDPKVHRILMRYLIRRNTPTATVALREFADAEDDRPWLWMEAISRLYSNRRVADTKELSEKHRHRLLLIHPGNHDSAARVAKEKALAALLTPKFQAMDNDKWVFLLQRMTREVDRKIVTRSMIDFLRGVTDYRKAGFAIDRVVRQINLWHGVNIAELGVDVERFTPGLGWLDFQRIATDAIQWYETGVDPSVPPAGYKPKHGDLRVIWRDTKNPEQSRIGLWQRPREPETYPRQKRLTQGDLFAIYRIVGQDDSRSLRFTVQIEEGLISGVSNPQNHTVYLADLPAVLGRRRNLGKEFAALLQKEVWVEEAGAQKSILSGTKVLEKWRRALQTPPVADKAQRSVKEEKLYAGQPYSHWVKVLETGTAKTWRRDLNPEVIPALIEALDHDRPAIREAAASALKMMGRKAVPKLVEALKTQSTTIRATALRVLGSMREKAIDALPAAIEAMTDKNSTVRDSARIALLLIGPDAPDEVLKAMTHEHSYVRREAITTLRKILRRPDDRVLIDKAVPLLIVALKDEQRNIYVFACQALGIIGPRAADAVPALIEMLSQAGYSMREQAARALGRMGKSAMTAVPALQKALGHNNASVRFNSACALASIRPEDPDVAAEAIPVLIAGLQPALKRKDALRLRNAAEALGQIGPSAKAAVPYLRKVFAQSFGSDWTIFTVRTKVAWALAKIDPQNQKLADEVIPSLVEILKSRNPYLPNFAAQAIGEFGPKAAGAVPALVGAFKGRHGSGLNNFVLDALGRIGPAAKTAVPELREALTHRRECIRIIAAIALARIAPKDQAMAAKIRSLLKRAIENNKPIENIFVTTRIGWTVGGPLSPRMNAYIRGEAKQAMARINAHTPASRKAAQRP